MIRAFKIWRLRRRFKEICRVYKSWIADRVVLDAPCQKCDHLEVFGELSECWACYPKRLEVAERLEDGTPLVEWEKEA